MEAANRKKTLGWKGTERAQRKKRMYEMNLKKKKKRLKKAVSNSEEVGGVHSCQSLLEMPSSGQKWVISVMNQVASHLDSLVQPQVSTWVQQLASVRAER